MARRASGRIALNVNVNEENDALGVGDGVGRIQHYLDLVASFSSGTADGQIDRAWSFNGTATSSAATLDLSGAMSSLIGAGNFVLADLVAIVYQNTGTANLQIGVGAAPVGILTGTTPVLVVPPGGWGILHMGAAGLAIANGVSDQITFASPTSTTYRLIIVGRSA